MVAWAARIPQCLGRVLRREGGQDLVEYALIILLVALVVVGALELLGPVLQNTYYERAAGMFPD